ncbi:MAG: hypothetical protein AAAB35_11125 [Phyllobacterium sp.]|uniref:hypothetical protein n=1 Tax=Phyllobacterium sp. TaxID=1871046 RepID=UPI0030EFD372
MTAKRVAQRQPTASVVRDQIQRPEFQQAVRSTSTARVDKKTPKQFLDLLEQLEIAEARTKKRR